MAGRCVGVLGGMGPEATVDMFRKIVRNTPATHDQDHLHILVDCDPSVPDRTAAILGQGPSPLPYLLAMGRRLRAAGADVLVIACNTAHYYYDALAASLGGTVIHMPREAARALRELLPEATKAGLLATTGSIVSRVYHQALLSYGFQALVPPDASQSSLMDAIYGPQGIKAGNLGDYPRRTILGIAYKLIEAGAEGLVLGCTEIPLVVGPEDFVVPAVDATEAAAKAVVREALSMPLREGRL